MLLARNAAGNILQAVSWRGGGGGYITLDPRDTLVQYFYWFLEAFCSSNCGRRFYWTIKQSIDFGKTLNKSLLLKMMVLYRLLSPQRVHLPPFSLFVAMLAAHWQYSLPLHAVCLLNINHYFHSELSRKNVPYPLHYYFDYFFYHTSTPPNR